VRRQEGLQVAVEARLAERPAAGVREGEGDKGVGVIARLPATQFPHPRLTPRRGRERLYY